MAPTFLHGLASFRFRRADSSWGRFGRLFVIRDVLRFLRSLFILRFLLLPCKFFTLTLTFLALEFLPLLALAFGRSSSSSDALLLSLPFLELACYSRFLLCLLFPLRCGALLSLTHSCANSFTVFWFCGSSRQATRTCGLQEIVNKGRGNRNRGNRTRTSIYDAGTTPSSPLAFRHFHHSSPSCSITHRSSPSVTVNSSSPCAWKSYKAVASRPSASSCSGEGGDGGRGGMMAGLASEKWTPFLLGLLAPLVFRGGGSVRCTGG
jgi:hypothetical protein